jgi:hypothetical protein
MSKKQEYISSEELGEKWKENETHFLMAAPALINLYQFCLPLLVLTVVDVFLYYCFMFFSVPLLIEILLIPLIVIVNYVGYIWLMAKFCKFLGWILEKKSPPKTGVFSRKFSEHQMADPAMDYYHLRGFMYKWPVWVAKKSIFPWMVNYVLNEIGGNKYHRDSLYGDSFVSLEFTEFEEGVVVGDGICISSHVVDSIFGNLTLEYVKLEKNAIVHSNAVIAPGSVIPPISIAPRSFCVKNWKWSPKKEEAKDAKFVWGVPTRKYRTESFINFLPSTLKKEWENRKIKFQK